MQTAFAERLKQAVDEAGFTGKDWPEKRLASEFHVTPQALSKWLKGETMPTPTHAQQVATRLGVRRAWLIDGELPMRAIEVDLAEGASSYRAQKDSLSLSGEEFRLLNHYRGLPRGLQQRLLDFLDELASSSSRR
jgi:transcriptional regulator with XRE-family HTH domain